MLLSKMQKLIGDTGTQGHDFDRDAITGDRGNIAETSSSCL